jgi:hypothetical protein
MLFKVVSSKSTFKIGTMKESPTMCKLDSLFFVNAKWDIHFDTHVLPSPIIAPYSLPMIVPLEDQGV